MPPAPSVSSRWYSRVDEAAREAHLIDLQRLADGPTERLEIRESSRGKSLACAVFGGLMVALGGWLSWVFVVIGITPGKPVFLLAWAVSLALVLAGVAALALAEALRRRHGQCVLALTPNTLTFSNSNGAVPLHTFSGFEIDQRHLRTVLTFRVAAHARAPALHAACFKSLTAPDAHPVAGGLSVELWLCVATLNGQRIDFEALTSLLLDYIEAAQARRTLGELYPQVQRFGAAR